MFKKLLTALAIAAVVFGLVFYSSENWIFFDGFEKGWSDFRFTFREPEPFGKRGVPNPYVSERVQLYGFDDSSLARLGKWPWSRDVHAKFLNRVQQFSPESVHFDVLFADPEKAPEGISEAFAGNPALKSTVENAFLSLDRQLEDELKAHSNVYIDLFLSRTIRPDLNLERVIDQMDVISDRYAQPSVYDHSIYFKSFIEPILPSFFDNVNPASVNVDLVGGTKLTHFYMAHPYERLDESKHNIYSLVMQLLARYYFTDLQFAVITPEKTTFQFAKVPILEKKTDLEQGKYEGQMAVGTMELDKLLPEIDEYFPQDSYNENLKNYIYNSLKEAEVFFEDEEKIPPYRLHLWKKPDGKYAVLRGKEILDAAIAVGSKKVQFHLYREQDLEIMHDESFRYGPYAIAINYPGPEQKGYQIGNQTVREFTIPKKSFLEGTDIPSLPDLPLVEDDLSFASSGLSAEFNNLQTWFYPILEKKVRLIQQQIRFAEGSADEARLIQYAINPDNFDGYYVLWKNFLDLLYNQTGTMDKATFLANFAPYKNYLAQQAQDANVLSVMDPSEAGLITELSTVWGEGFQNHYNKFLFAGAFAVGMADDVKDTPYGKMYGINSIISAFSTVATDNQITQVSTLVSVLTYLLIALIFAVLYYFVDVRISPFILLVTLFATFLVNYMIFANTNAQMEIAPHLLVNLGVFIGAVIIKVLTEEKDKRFLKATFSSYLAPELIDEMYQSKQFPSLGGESRECTAFFTDIQGFSTFSEKLTAEQLVELLNEYLGSMTDILLTEKGTLDKYIGDAIIGIFGAPAHTPDHSYRSLKVAVKMQDNLKNLREKWQAEKQLPDEENRNFKNLPEEEWEPGARWPKIVWDMRVRIGVNTGDMVTGNMGSTMRMNYTMMGDSVNLAARLEAGAKQFGVFTLISEATWEHSYIDENGESQSIKDLVEGRFIDKITVVGKSEPVSIYEVHALKGDLTEKETELFDTFNKGVAAYREQRWDEAIDLFEKAHAIELYPTNKTTPSKMYVERCHAFKENPPPADWDGVFRMTQKH